MRLLEALRILEAATIECKLRSIDTLDVREALDLLDPYLRSTWSVEGFRDHLSPCHEFGPSLEGQQQNLRVNFAGIHRNVRRLLTSRVGRLRFRYRKTKDPALEAELDRLVSELKKLPERWEFVSVRRCLKPFAMAKYFSRSCPRCNGYVGIVVHEPERNTPLQAINGHCLGCGYRFAWILIEGRSTVRTKRRASSIRGDHQSVT